MKISELIKELASFLVKDGDLEVKISLLTEDDDIDLNINSVDEWADKNYKTKFITITHDTDSDLLNQKLNLDNVIEKIVFMVFNNQVDLNDPYETFKQIKNILKEEKL